MQTVTSIRRFGSSLRALGLAAVLSASSAGAAIVWDLNPSNQDGVVLGPSQVFTSGGFQITARGYNDADTNGIGEATNLYYKNRPIDNGATESGLGLATSAHNELNANSNNQPVQFLQLDLRSILTQGATNGAIAVASLQNGEGFKLFGSDTLGVLGTQLAGPFTGLTFDNQFVSIPSFGEFDFISVVAASGASHVLPSQFRADVTPIPEVGTVMPIVGLLVAVGATHVLRRRRSSMTAA